MKTLYVLRHAKASSNYDEYADIDRPLKSSGIKSAYMLGSWLKRQDIQVDKLLVSDAARALHTASIVARAAGFPPNTISVDHTLYLPDEGSTLKSVQQVDDSISRLMLVGHNPDLSILCSEVLNDMAIELPTCGLVAITFNTGSWRTIAPSNARKEFEIFPE
jgi:Phosphohistidine phosphatase SixA